MAEGGDAAALQSSAVAELQRELLAGQRELCAGQREAKAAVEDLGSLVRALLDVVQARSGAPPGSRRCSDSSSAPDERRQFGGAPTSAAPDERRQFGSLTIRSSAGSPRSGRVLRRFASRGPMMHHTNSGVSSLNEESETARSSRASEVAALSTIALEVARATRGDATPVENMGLHSLSSDSVTGYAMRNSGLARDHVFDPDLHSEGSVRRMAWSTVCSPWFDTFIGAVVILNAVCIGIEVQLSIKSDVPGALRSMDIGFLCVYAFELVLRLVAEGSQMCKRLYFLFDVALVVTGVVTQMAELFGSDSYAVVEHLLVLRSLRIFRVVRAVRVLDFFQELWKLFTGLLLSSRIVLAAFILIFLVMYIFACVGVELITKSRTLNEAPETRLIVDDKFDSIFSFMLTLIQFSNADSIGSIFMPIVRQEPFLAAYFVALVLVVTTLCMNLVTAAIVDSVLRTGRNDKEFTCQRIRAQTQRYVPVLKRVFQSIDWSGEGMLRYEDLEKSIEEIRKLGLPSSLARILEPSTLQYAFELMDDDEDGMVNLTEFVRGVFGLAYTELPLETTHMLELLRRQSRHVHELVRQGEVMTASVNGIVERLEALQRSKKAS